MRIKFSFHVLEGVSRHTTLPACVHPPPSPSPLPPLTVTRKPNRKHEGLQLCLRSGLQLQSVRYKAYRFPYLGFRRANHSPTTRPYTSINKTINAPGTNRRARAAVMYTRPRRPHPQLDLFMGSKIGRSDWGIATDPVVMQAWHYCGISIHVQITVLTQTEAH